MYVYILVTQENDMLIWLPSMYTIIDHIYN